MKFALEKIPESAAKSGNVSTEGLGSEGGCLCSLTTLQETKISHLWKRKIIFKRALEGDMSHHSSVFYPARKGRSRIRMAERIMCCF